MAAGARIKAIIFDIGRVLIRVDLSRAMVGLSEAIPLSPDELWKALQNDPHWMDWQEGRISPRDWHLHITKRLGGTLSFDEFCAAWNRALDPQPIQSEEFLGGLAKKHKMAVLSKHRSHSYRSRRGAVSVLPVFSGAYLFLPRRRQQAEPADLPGSVARLQSESAGGGFY
ncbi:MAG TPA: hypothetical protein VOA78_14360 [Candidatus Dormibacteraeota bacterium]|nr:hypothetical protein [Candidatus Dormibacteraeota bacterium]